MFRTDPNANSDFIKVGKITKPHGLRGEVRLLSYIQADFYQANLKITLTDGQTLIIKSVKQVKNFVILKFIGLDKIEEVEDLRDLEGYLPRSLVVDSTNEVLVDDLVGFTVLLPEKNQEIGMIEGFYDAGSDGLYKIMIKEEIKESLKKEENDFFVPAELSTFQNVDFNQKKLEIILIDQYWW